MSRDDPVLYVVRLSIHASGDIYLRSQGHVVLVTTDDTVGDGLNRLDYLIKQDAVQKED